jgi:hypothetical protein
MSWAQKMTDVTDLCANVGVRDSLVDLAKQLDLAELQTCALAFLTGKWHPGVKRFAVKYSMLVDALALEGI